MEKIEDEPRIMCGPTPESHGVGTRQFDGLVKSVATSANRVGEAANYGLFFWRGLPDDIVKAADKIREAQKLLLGAHALLRAASQVPNGT